MTTFLKNKMAQHTSLYATLFGLLIGITLCVVFPKPSYATIPLVDDWIQGFVKDTARGFLKFAFGSVSMVGQNDIFIGSWDKLLGTSDTNFAQFVKNICNGVVKPIAAGVLGFVFMFQFVKIATHVESKGTIPFLHEVVVLFVMLTIMNFMVAYADDICISIYEIVNSIAKKIADPSFTHAVNFADASVDNIVNGLDSPDLGDLIVLSLLALIFLLSSFVAYALSWVAAFGRALQIYLYITFSPLPLSFLGFDETKSMGVGFLKNFGAVCLAGSIMVFSIVAYPIILAAAVDVNALNSGGFVTEIIKLIAVNWVLSTTLMKSGSWAKEIVGS